MLLLGHLFIGEPPTWNTFFHHYRKWSNVCEWKTAFMELLSENKDKVDLSLPHIEGSHTPVYRGWEKASYQGRKKWKTTNALFLSYRNGLPLAMSEQQARNHTDLFEIDGRIDDVMQQLKDAGISTYCLISNLDAGLAQRISVWHLMAMMRSAMSDRTGQTDAIPLRNIILTRRCIWIVERKTPEWTALKAVLTIFDTIVLSWKGWSHLAVIVISLKKLHKSK